MSASEAKEATKRVAALAALAEIKPGMKVGLGTGTTVAQLIPELGKRVANGLLVRCCATSLDTDNAATAHGIRIEPPQNLSRLDLTIDGADAIDGNLNLIKGGGGALVREKIIAQMSERLLIIADDTKLVDRLDNDCTLPVAVLPFAADITAARIGKVATALTGRKQKVTRRLGADGKALVSDDGLAIFDVSLQSPAGASSAEALTEEIFDADEMDAALLQCCGVVATGFFIGLASEAYIARCAPEPNASAITRLSR